MPPLVTTTACAARSNAPTSTRELAVPRAAVDGSSTAPRTPVTHAVGDGQLVHPVPEPELAPGPRRPRAGPAARTARRAPGPGAPRDVEAGHRVAVSVGEVAAALGPAHDREEADAHRRAATPASRLPRSRRTRWPTGGPRSPRPQGRRCRGRSPPSRASPEGRGPRSRGCPDGAARASRRGTARRTTRTPAHRGSPRAPGRAGSRACPRRRARRWPPARRARRRPRSRLCPRAPPWHAPAAPGWHDPAPPGPRPPPPAPPGRRPAPPRQDHREGAVAAVATVVACRSWRSTGHPRGTRPRPCARAWSGGPRRDPGARRGPPARARACGRGSR